MWDEYLDGEPGVWLLDAGRLESVFEAFALMADLRSGYFAGHSPRVAALARAAAAQRGLGAEDVALVGQAGLLHDIGRLAVPTGLWDKQGALTAGEWERVQLHSYYTDRVLRQGFALVQHADIGGRCHERLGGGGYHRGDRDASGLVRLLAAADVYVACTEPRAHRPALTPEQARRVLLDDAAHGRLCAAAVDATLAAAGQEPGPPAPGALSPREREVLTLLVQGLSNKEIARRLAISPRTVQHHTIHIYGKAGVKSRAGVALWAIEQGLFSRPATRGPE